MTVYDSSPKVNKQGVLIEQRALALFYHEGNDEYHTKILERRENATPHKLTFLHAR